MATNDNVNPISPETETLIMAQVVVLREQMRLSQDHADRMYLLGKAHGLELAIAIAGGWA